jgi:hypothetical protein
VPGRRLVAAADVTVSCTPSGDGDGWSCAVTIVEGSSSTRHVVSVSGAELARLAPGAAEPTDVVTRSIEFLLAREPKESILSRFALSVIGRYFPEYERTIRG